jgi:hypothetical protein
MALSHAFRRCAQAHRDAPPQAIHHEERLAQHRGIGLEPAGGGHADAALLAQYPQQLELGLEAGVVEELLRTRMDAEHVVLRLSRRVAPCRFEQDRLIGDAGTERVFQVGDGDRPAESFTQPGFQALSGGDEIAAARGGGTLLLDGELVGEGFVGHCAYSQGLIGPARPPSGWPAADQGANGSPGW